MDRQSQLPFMKVSEIVSLETIQWPNVKDQVKIVVFKPLTITFKGSFRINGFTLLRKKYQYDREIPILCQRLKVIVENVFKPFCVY
jgi:hypothetical protein